MNKTLKLAIGTEFGSWLVISDKTKRINNLTNWKCRCVCGTEEYIPLNNLMNESSTKCQKCANKISGQKRRKGVGELSGDQWAQIKNKIKKKHPSFKVRLEEAWEQFLRQNERCFLSNRKIELTGYPYNKKSTTAEYVLNDDGVEGFWVHKNVAKLLRHMSKSDLIKLANDIRNTVFKQ